jgi:hypothetical protein
MSVPSRLTLLGAGLAGLVLALHPSGTALASPLRPGFNGSTLGITDDGSAGPIGLGFTANFFGSEHVSVYVNNNGNLTLDGVLDGFTPTAFSAADRRIIAPFFADVDTRASGSVGYGTGQVDGRNAFGATWTDVGYFAEHAERTNTFQALLVDRSDTGAGNFDIEFNYAKVEWETGDSSGGSGGLGGDSARVGYSNGTGTDGTFFELPGSGVAGSLLDGSPTALLEGSLNSDIAGRYVFHVRNDGISPDVEPPDTDPPDTPPADVPEPATLLLGLSGLLLVSGRAWLRRG